jgi:hypothetical protein
MAMSALLPKADMCSATRASALGQKRTSRLGASSSPPKRNRTEQDASRKQ